MSDGAVEDDIISNIKLKVRDHDTEAALELWEELWLCGCRDSYKWLDVVTVFESKGIDDRVFPLFLRVALEIGISNDWFLASLARLACSAGIHHVSIKLCTLSMERPINDALRYHVARCLYISNFAIGKPLEAIKIFIKCFSWFPFASVGSLPVGFLEVVQLCQTHGFHEYAKEFFQNRIPDELQLPESGPPAGELKVLTGLDRFKKLIELPGSKVEFKHPRSINNIWPVGENFSNDDRMKLNLYQLDNVRIIGSGGCHVVLIDDGDLISEFSNFYANRITLRKLKEFDKLFQGESKFQDLDSVFFIRDIFSTPNICHFLFDQVTRLALGAQAGLDLKSVKIIGPEMKAEFQFEIIRMLGLEHEQFLGTDDIWAYKCERLYIPDNVIRFSHPANLCDPWARDFLRKSFLQENGNRESSPERIYVSRERSTGRRIKNETELRLLLEEFGFTTIYSETLTFSEQVRIFSGASHIVAPHGAGLTNIVFCKPNTKILELFHPFYASPAYFYVARSCGLDYSIGCDSTLDLSAYNASFSYSAYDFFAPLESVRTWLMG